LLGRPRWDPLVLVTLGAAFLYALLTVDRGWIPHDDGMLGQAAERVLRGELPHRDFHDVYTGGLSYWHALSFVLFGVHLLSPRILLLGSFGIFLLAAYGVARRFAPPRTSASVVLLISVWSVPNYPAAMPTWYNLFLAVVALWCLFGFLETERRGWLLAAGAACGLSIVMKIVGLYTLAAMLIVLAVVDAERTADRSEPSFQRGAYTYVITLASGLCLYALLVTWLVRDSLDAVSLVHFVVPSAAIVATAAWRIVRSNGGVPSKTRFARLSALVTPFLTGAIVPVALLAMPYVITGSLGELVMGTLVRPFRRLSFAAAAPLPLGLFAPTLIPVTLAVAVGLSRGLVRRVALFGLVAVLSATFAFGGATAMYRASWGGLLLAPLLATLAALAAAVRAWLNRGRSALPLQVVAVASVLGTFTLVQYPFSGPVYFFYLAPLVALAGLAALAPAPGGWRASALALYCFTLAFGARWVGTAALYPTAQGRFEPRPPAERLELDRGRIRVAPAEKAEYERLARMMRDRARGSDVTFVTPDAPEAYFLSGLRNPTPVFYDFLDDPEGRTARILDALEREHVRVVALNRAPQFSGPPPRDLIEAIESRFPQAASVGRFIVRWR
jgi:hypothetical protein